MPFTIPAPRESGRTATTSAPLYWCTYGPPASPPVLVLHGGPGAHHDYLLPQMLRLATKRSLVFYDQRGGGRSRSDDASSGTWQAHVEDMAHVVRELKLAPLTVVGYSWGALLALLYSIETLHRPALPRPNRLVLIDPAPLSRPFRAAFEAEFARRQRSEALREMREELSASGLRDSDPATYRQRQFELGVAAYFARPEAVHDLTPFRVTARVQEGVWHSLGDFDLIPQLESVHVPAFFIHGRQDPIPLDSTVQAARAMRARLLVLEASGHVPYVEQPDALFSAIEQFLEETPATRG